jgi:hypothetical protein
MRPVSARGHSALCLKLGVVLLAGAGTAAGMLSVRQERINAAYELTESVGRRADVDRAMLALRIEIARRTTPEATRRMADALGPLGPILRDWCPPALRESQVAALPIPTDEAIDQ